MTAGHQTADSLQLTIRQLTADSWQMHDMRAGHETAPEAESFVPLALVEDCSMHSDLQTPPGLVTPVEHGQGLVTPVEQGQGLVQTCKMLGFLWVY